LPYPQEVDAAAAVADQPAGNVAQGVGVQPGSNVVNGAQLPATPAAPQQQQNHNEPRRVCLQARDLLRDFEQDKHEVYNSPQENLGATLTTLVQLEDTPVIRRLQAHICVANAQVEERGPGYSRSAASSYSRSRLERSR
jgi:hypothetical protein